MKLANAAGRADAALPCCTVTSGGGYTTTTRVITYTYDSLNRLTGAAYRSASLTAGSTGGQFEYQYDAIGNRTATRNGKRPNVLMVSLTCSETCSLHLAD